MRFPKAFRDFDIEKSSVALWLFRIIHHPGQPPAYVGRWIETHDALDSKLREAVAAERERLTELREYSLLAENNESSALAIDALLTNAGLVIQEAAAEVPARRVKEMPQIQNTVFYVIKLTKSGTTLFAIRKTEGSWQTKRRKDAIYAFFTNNQLGLDDKPSFRISKDVDFFVVDDQILILHKGRFESILAYRQAHIEDFELLQKDQVFKSLFSTLNPLVTFVGTNKIHLRRACAIHEKAHYKNAAFMARLRGDHTKYQLNLVFDAQGRLVPTDETCADIIRALLDHRLLSPFSEQVYDVQDAAPVT